VKLFVRPVNLPEERKRLTELLGRNLPDFGHDARFEWIYDQNPAGRGRAWFVCAGRDDEVIGTASIFPRFVWIDRQLAVSAQVGDFAVDVSHRSLGPALMLQKATLGPVDEGQFAFCYDCPPHDRGMATFQRIGLSPVCRMARLSRLIRAKNAIRKRVPGGSVVRTPLAFAANLWLRTTAFTYRGPENTEIEIHEGAFGEEFSSFDESLAKSEAETVRARRHADDLNWRFRRHPVRSYRVVTARRDGTLAGFAVFRCGRERARLFDILSTSDEIQLALLHRVAEEARAEGVSSIDLLTVASSRDESLAARAGYVPRGKAERVVVYPSESARPLLSSAMLWKLRAADIMV
jgi:hypothetical protein